MLTRLSSHGKVWIFPFGHEHYRLFPWGQCHVFSFRFWYSNFKYNGLSKSTIHRFQRLKFYKIFLATFIIPLLDALVLLLHTPSSFICNATLLVGAKIPSLLRIHFKFKSLDLSFLEFFHLFLCCLTKIRFSILLYPLMYPVLEFANGIFRYDLSLKGRWCENTQFKFEKVYGTFGHEIFSVRLSPRSQFFFRFWSANLYYSGQVWNHTGDSFCWRTSTYSAATCEFRWCQSKKKKEKGYEFEPYGSVHSAVKMCSANWGQGCKLFGGFSSACRVLCS